MPRTVETKQEVVVTGLGLVTAGARSPQALFERICAGDACITVKDDLKAAGSPHPVGAYIDSETWSWLMARSKLEFRYECWDGPLTRLTVCAADQAFAQSSLDERRHRAGVFVASSQLPGDIANLAEVASCLECDASIDLDRLSELAYRKGVSYTHTRHDMSALVLACRYGFQEVVMTLDDACAASGSAIIGTAYRYIRHGELDVALAGGTELLSEFLPSLDFKRVGVTGDQRSIDPCTAWHPGDGTRSGFARREGSAFLVLESAAHAYERGIQPLARILGFARQAEAGKVSASAQDGSELVRCMQAALDEASLKPDDIDHINAHGTSTYANDAGESFALARVFGERAAAIPVTFNTAALGYSPSATGAIEAVLSVLSLFRGILLPTFNYRKPDSDLPPLNRLAEPRRWPLRNIMSSSFGMGGENCSLILTAA